MLRFNTLPLSQQMIVSLRSAEWLKTADSDLFLPVFTAGELLTALSYFNIQIGRNGTPDVDEFMAMIEHMESGLESECNCASCGARK